MNKNILVVAYYFPPHTGAGIQRPLRMVTGLLNDGYRVTVISSKLQSDKSDISFVKDLESENLKIIYLEDYVENLSKKFNYRILNKVINFLTFPDKEFFWYFLNKTNIDKIFLEFMPSKVLTTIGPYSSSLVGLYLKKRYKVEWILDYRDSWSNNPSMKLRKIKPLFWNLSKYLEKYINKYSDKIITVSEPLKNYILESDKQKISILYNGYRANDFLGYEKKISNKFEIFFMGSMYAERRPELFIEPFLSFITTLKNEEKKMIKFNIVGHNSLKTYEFIKIKLKEIDVYCENYISHNEVLELTKKASLLLIIVDSTYASETVVTGKIFEYINMKAPILGIVPEYGAAASIINKTSCGIAINPNNSNKVTSQINEIYKSWKEDKGQKEFNLQKNFIEIQYFSSEALYLNLKNILEK